MALDAIIVLVGLEFILGWFRVGLGLFRVGLGFIKGWFIVGLGSFKFVLGLV